MKIDQIILLTILIVLIIGSSIIGGMFYFMQKSLQTKAIEHNESVIYRQLEEDNGDIDQTIKTYVLDNSELVFTDIVIKDKKFFIDDQGIKWLKFEIEFVPKEANDSVYGIMTEIDGNWKGYNFGTCCIENDLSPEVKKGLGFDMSNE